jgi:hypothetical protein
LFIPVQKSHNICGKRVEVKKALSRSEINSAQSRQGGGAGGRPGGNQWGGPQNSWNPSGGQGGWGKIPDLVLKENVMISKLLLETSWWKTQ